MCPATHQFADACEDLKVALLHREHRVPSEVRDDRSHQLRNAAHLVLERPVRPIGTDRAAPEGMMEQLNDLCAVAVLADREARADIPPECVPLAAVERDAEAALAVSVSGEVGSKIHRRLPRSRYRRLVAPVDLVNDPPGDATSGRIPKSLRG